MKAIVWTCDNCKKRIVVDGKEKEYPDPPFKHYLQWDFCCIECAREFIKNEERNKRWSK